MTAIKPGEALALAAQVAVTLAGFAGVVVVFRPQSPHHWSSVDRLRLRLLLNNSILPLAYSFIGISLLAISPPPESIWRWCSALVTLCQVVFGVLNFMTVRKFSATEFKSMNKLLFFPFFAVGIATILLQLYNVAIWNWFWPFFLGIVVHLLAAMLQFMRLVLLPRPEEPPGIGAKQNLNDNDGRAV